MAGAGPLTSDELAAKTGLSERWVREWLQGQAAASSSSMRTASSSSRPKRPSSSPMKRTRLRPSAAFAGLPDQFYELKKSAAPSRPGIGFTYDDGGEAVARGVERMFAPWHKTMLTTTALPAIPGLVEKLKPARWSRMWAAAPAWQMSLLRARSRRPRCMASIPRSSPLPAPKATSPRPASRTWQCTTLTTGDGLPAEPTFDLVMCLDCLHDMARPDIVAAAIRKSIKPDGAWFIVDIECARLRRQPSEPARRHDVWLLAC